MLGELRFRELWRFYEQGGYILKSTSDAVSGGSHAITISASNGVSPAGTQSFTLTVKQAPAITSVSSTTFTVNTAGSFTVTATGYPAPTFTETGSLPGGIILRSAGVLSGTASTTGSFPITITASNGVGSNATQSFTLTVGQAPIITSANNTTFTVGTSGSFTVTASGFPATMTFSESGSFAQRSNAQFVDGRPKQHGDGQRQLSHHHYGFEWVLPNATQSFTLTVSAAAASKLALGCPSAEFRHKRYRNQPGDDSAD